MSVALAHGLLHLCEQLYEMLLVVRKWPHRWELMIVPYANVGISLYLRWSLCKVMSSIAQWPHKLLQDIGRHCGINTCFSE